MLEVPDPDKNVSIQALLEALDAVGDLPVVGTVPVGPWAFAMVRAAREIRRSRLFIATLAEQAPIDLQNACREFLQKGKSGL